MSQTCNTFSSVSIYSDNLSNHCCWLFIYEVCCFLLLAVDVDPWKNILVVADFLPYIFHDYHIFCFVSGRSESQNLKHLGCVKSLSHNTIVTCKIFWTINRCITHKKKTQAKDRGTVDSLSDVFHQLKGRVAWPSAALRAQNSGGRRPNNKKQEATSRRTPFSGKPVRNKRRNKRTKHQMSDGILGGEQL